MAMIKRPALVNKNLNLAEHRNDAKLNSNKKIKPLTMNKKALLMQNILSGMMSRQG